MYYRQELYRLYWESNFTNVKTLEKYRKFEFYHNSMHEKQSSMWKGTYFESWNKTSIYKGNGRKKRPFVGTIKFLKQENWSH